MKTVATNIPAKSNNKPVDSLSGTPTVSSSELLKGNKTIVIEHNGDNYRLQVTRSQKLILTK